MNIFYEINSSAGYPNGTAFVGGSWHSWKKKKISSSDAWLSREWKIVLQRESDDRRVIGWEGFRSTVLRVSM